MLVLWTDTKIRNSFRTSGAGQLAGNGKTSISYRTSGADQLADNRKISHKRKVSSATAEEPSFIILSQDLINQIEPSLLNFLSSKSTDSPTNDTL